MTETDKEERRNFRVKRDEKGKIGLDEALREQQLTAVRRGRVAVNFFTRFDFALWIAVA
jgi:hypothetical protein